MSKTKEKEIFYSQSESMELVTKFNNNIAKLEKKLASIDAKIDDFFVKQSLGKKLILKV